MSDGYVLAHIEPSYNHSHAHGHITTVIVFTKDQRAVSFDSL